LNKYLNDQRVKANNAMISKAQNIQKLVILRKDFSPDTGELTPTMKMKRPVVNKMYAAEIEALYA